jgi:hypothetical protein
MKKLFSHNAKVLFCDELVNQNSKAITSVNDGLEKIGNQNTNSLCSPFILRRKLKTKQCKELRA